MKSANHLSQVKSTFKADFHIHSCLSPCASLLMSPGLIAQKAKEAGLNLIALTDHNSPLNCEVTIDICSKIGIRCLPGMEVQTREEVHILCIFEKLSQALELGRVVYDHLPDIQNDPDRFGDQVYVDENDVILGTVSKYLGNAADLSINELLKYVRELGGLFIPAHIDRPIYSMTSQLGFLPLEDYDAIELTPAYLKAKNPKSIDNIDNYSHISDSDSHYPDSIGSCYNVFELEDITFGNLREALRNKENRTVLL